MVVLLLLHVLVVFIDNSGGSDQYTHICFDFRPWYVQSATRPKYVVYLIDRSAGMAAYFKIAKRIMKLFLKTSNPSDEVIGNNYNSEHANIYVCMCARACVRSCVSVLRKGEHL